MAFMFIEIILLQKFILFLDHPIYSASIVIFSLLFASSLGSLFSKPILAEKIKKRLRLSLILIVGFILFVWLIYPVFLEIFIGYPLMVKMILVFLFIFPLGFFMGIPFPTGIRLISKKTKDILPWAWSTNAFSSVIGSTLVLWVAFGTGFNFVLILAAAGYLITIIFSELLPS